MASTLQEVADDLTTVLWDYADSSGVNNPGNVKTWFGLGGAFNLSAPAATLDVSDRQGDGAQSAAFSYDEIVQSSFRMRAQAASLDDLRAGIGQLQRLLAADGVVKWVPTGSSTTLYIQRKPSSIPSLFRGDAAELYERLALFDSPKGVEVVMNRERLLRGDVLLASVNQALNPTLILADPAASPGMLNWAWDSTTNITTSGYGANVYWPNQSYRFVIATTATRNLQQTTGTGSAAPGDVWTLSFYARATGGALAKAQAVIEYLSSGGGVLATSGGTMTTLTSTEKRLTVTTPAAPASTSKIRMSLRMANGDGASYTVDFRRVQLEEASSASQFRCGSIVVGNKVNYGPGKAMLVYNPGDANALARLSLAPSAGALTLAYLLGRRSEGLDTNLAEAINPMTSSTSSYRTKAIVVDKTMYSGTSGDTSSVADSGTTTGNAAKTTFTNIAPMVRRWRWVSTPTDPESLHGLWDVYVVVKGETASLYRLRMHWQAANRDPVTEVEPEVQYDCTDTTTAIYTPLFLGRVAFNAQAGDTALTIEGWAARDSGSGALWWDSVLLVPADEQQCVLQVPGFRAGEQSRETWLGSELDLQAAGATDTNATVSGTKAILAIPRRVVGSQPGTSTSGGTVWAAGRHIATTRVDIRRASGSSTAIAYFRIRKAPGPGGTVPDFQTTHAYSVGDFVKPTSLNRIGRTYRCTTAGTSGGSEPSWAASYDTDGVTVPTGTAVFTETTVASRTIKGKSGYTLVRNRYTVSITADGTTAYEVVIAASTDADSLNRVDVLNIRHQTQRTVDDGYAMKMIGDTEQIGTFNGAVFVDPLAKQGPFVTLGPGLNLVWLDLWTAPTVGYEEVATWVDGTLPVAKSDPTLTTTAGADVIPRYWG